MPLPTRLAAAVLVTGLASASPTTALADESTATLEEEVVTVVGTRTERSLKQVGATVSVISAEEIERTLTRDIADLVRYEPGVSVAGTGSRFGLSGFNIRGIEGDRVLTIVDGVRVPDEFSFGPFLDSRRDFVDVDSVEIVEIARGPISSLYGSDALGGVVSFTTRKPFSYVGDDNPFYAGVNGGYSSDDNSVAGTATLAAGNDTVAALLTYTYRDGEETETAGSSGGVAGAREEADPQDIEVDNIALKLEFSPAEGHTFLLGYDLFEQNSDARILSDYGSVLTSPFGPPTIINTRDATDAREREKWSLAYAYETEDALVDHISVQLYQQTSFSEQLTNETRTSPTAGPLSRFRYSEFEQEIEGAYLQAGSTFATGGLSHTLTYGIDYYKTDNQSLRDGGTFNAAGVPQFEFSPFPTRDFPLTEVTQLAYFAQDEIELLDGALRLTPGARYDQFDADTNADAVYLGGNPGSETPADYDDAELTLSFSAVYLFNEGWSAFARYSEGFRAPPYDDVNIGFTNPLGQYKAIANPDLVSETSQGVEVGVRWTGTLGNLSLAAFSNEYEDFIDSRALAPEFAQFGFRDPVDGFLVFKSINRAAVEIDGVELNGELRLEPLADALRGFSVRYAIAYADGEDTDLDEPLETINPLTGVLGIAYEAESSRWGGQLVATLVKGKDGSDIPTGSIRPETSGYGIIDLLAYVDVTENITVNVGLFNLTDREYIRWADTASIDSDALERFTQPGFNAGATVKVVF